MDDTLRDSAARAQRSPALEKGARLGYAASGLLHLLLGWLALQLVLGHTATADQTGALAALAATGVGKVLLWILLAGFVLLAAWQVAEAMGRRGRKRVTPAAKAVVYLALAWTAFRVLRGAATSGNQQSAGAAATLMSHPGGRLLVGVVGVVIVAVGLHHLVKGFGARFLADLRERPGRWVVAAGRLGYVAKGVALLLVGGLFVTAAVTADPQQAQGLDGALRTLLRLPLGQAALTVVALGFAAYGVYSFARARYARV
jgi:uncharacterized membrane protein